MKKLTACAVLLVAVWLSTTAFGAPPEPGSCQGCLVLQTDPDHDPDSWASRARNGDGWLRWNGRAWKDNR